MQFLSAAHDASTAVMAFMAPTLGALALIVLMLLACAVLAAIAMGGVACVLRRMMLVQLSSRSVRLLTVVADRAIDGARCQNSLVLSVPDEFIDLRDRFRATRARLEARAGFWGFINDAANE